MSEPAFTGHSGAHVDSFAPDHGWLAEIRFEDGTVAHVPLIGWAVVQGTIEPAVLLEGRQPALRLDLAAMGAELVRLTDRKTDFGWQ
ncbi:MAG: hypothetical protein QOE01_559 [Actinomycetota bacterium]|jgi:hypothetical protein|nr:hypothetical protein [Actinomycetota bacterium]